MARVQRRGDYDNGGGVLFNGVSSVLVNGRPIAVQGGFVTPHNPKPPKPHAAKHQVARTLATQRTVVAGNKPVVRTGDPDTCGHTRVGGSPNVYVGK